MDYAEYRNEKSGIAVIILDDTRLRVEIDGESYSGEYRSTNNKESRNEYIVVMDSEGGSLIDGVDGVWPMNTTFTYDPDPEGIRNFLQFRGLVYGEGGLTSFLQVQ
jgi:hypothetical protein